MQKGFVDCLKTPKWDAAGNQSRERLQEAWTVHLHFQNTDPSYKIPHKPIWLAVFLSSFCNLEKYCGKRVQHPSCTALNFRPVCLLLTEPQRPALRSGTTVTVPHGFLRFPVDISPPELLPCRKN